MVSIDIGKMRDRIDIEAQIMRQNDYGETLPRWTRKDTVWGAIRTLGGRQLQLAQANTITSTSTHQIEMRYTPLIVIGSTRLSVDATEGNTIKHPKRTFALNAIDDVDNRHVKLILTVTEVVA